MARTTSENFMVPDEQAEPEDTATPSRSSAIRAVCALIPGTANCSVLGTRRGACLAENDGFRPDRRAGPAPGAGAAPQALPFALDVAHGLRDRRAEAGDPDHVLGAAAPVALLAAAEAGAMRKCSSLARQNQARRRPSGPPILCAEIARRSAPSALISSGILPSAWTASTCSRPPAACADVGRLAHRLDHAGLVVGGHQRDQRLCALGGSRVRGVPRSSPSEATPSRSAPKRSTDGKSPPASTETCSMAETMAASQQPRPACSRFAAQRQRIGLRAAGGENHVARLGPDRRGNLLAGVAHQAWRAARPSPWTEDGFPTTSMAAAMAARACGRSGAVAFQSR